MSGLYSMITGYLAKSSAEVVNFLIKLVLNPEQTPPGHVPSPITLVKTHPNGSPL